MLREVKSAIGDFGNKTLIDTFYAIARLHRHKREEPYPTFFGHLLCDFMSESTRRLPTLGQHELAYLSKGMSYLNIGRKDELLLRGTVKTELELRKAFKERVMELAPSLDAYPLSKALKYLLA